MLPSVQEITRIGTFGMCTGQPGFMLWTTVWRDAQLHNPTTSDRIFRLQQTGSKQYVSMVRCMLLSRMGTTRLESVQTNLVSCMWSTVWRDAQLHNPTTSDRIFRLHQTGTRQYIKGWILKQSNYIWLSASLLSQALMWNPGGGTDPRSNQIIFDCLLAYCQKHSFGTKARIYTGQPICGSLSKGMLNCISLWLATGYLGFIKPELDNMLTLCTGIKGDVWGGS